MLTLLHKLYRIRLLTVAGLFHLFTALLMTGVNLMVLLRLAAKLHPTRGVFVNQREQLTYAQLWQQSETLAGALQQHYGVRPQQKIAIACRNHDAAIKAIFAVARLGAHLYLLNPEMSSEQLQAVEARMGFDLLIHDEALTPLLVNTALQNKALPAYHATADSIDRLSTQPNLKPLRLPKVTASAIVVMTGGTTGQPKSVSRKPSLVNYLPPFLALLTQVHLDRYQSLYVATPVCHGYGLAMLLIGLLLGVNLYFTERFEATQAGAFIATHNIEALIVVPVMLQRLLKIDPAHLASIQCIVTGGALLSPALAQAALNQLGRKLFNLYGTSEAGFCIIGTPALLAGKATALGQPVPGVQTKIIDAAGQEAATGKIGQLHIRSRWTANRHHWIATGDLAYCDADGDLFLCGRVDDMIVSGGENVYPVELEQVLAQHPDLEAVAVVGIPDAEFGQRLKAVVIPKPAATLDQAILLAWLKPRVARYQMPALIDFRRELPYTTLGKIDKKALK
ncbi:MAG: 2-succinylbenzoate--CoA ligase [Caldilinea sp. CFX5]|nr:2-succinylbenzoate--CoA ligase [Caldilinea sp. CFX5]